jgi:thiamine biosynthesis lipoprotein
MTLPAGGALATSNIPRHRWTHSGRTLHNILDPRKRWPAAQTWQTVTVAASSCVDANTVSAAAIVRGRDALDWIEWNGLPARLVDVNHQVRTVGNWPYETTAAA